MSVYNDKKIRTMSKGSAKLISPFNENNLSASSYDLTLGAEAIGESGKKFSINKLTVPRAFKVLKVQDDEGSRSNVLSWVEEDSQVAEAGQLTIGPGEFFLLTTNETVSIPNNCVGIVKGKSSLARKGLMIECAGVCDAGWTGQITLEVKNLNFSKSLILKPGMKIAQILFFEMVGEAETPYSKESGHHYQNQKGVTKAWDEEAKK